MLSQVMEKQNNEGQRSALLKLIAHDLKGPVHNIQMGLELLKNRKNGDKNDTLIHSIEQSTHQMSEMALALLDILTHGKTQRTKGNDSRVDIYEFAERILTAQRMAAQKKNIQLILRVQVAGLYGHFDEQKVGCALRNLITNAIKYSPENSIVDIGIEKSDAALRFFVLDRGPGIPEAERNKLFSPFAKISNRSQGGSISHQLGLSLTKQIVEESDGIIGYQPRVSGGSCFYFFLPQQQFNRRSQDSAVTGSPKKLMAQHLSI